jgi:hypothetical protein
MTNLEKVNAIYFPQWGVISPLYQIIEDDLCYASALQSISNVQSIIAKRLIVSYFSDIIKAAIIDENFELAQKLKDLVESKSFMKIYKSIDTVELITRIDAISVIQKN